jgi:hypothetical protein
MKNIIKTVIVMLTSISLFGSANAGELTVTGTAKATYNILSGYSSVGKGIGVANEFDLGASGELDNGFTWNYQVQMDPGVAGIQVNDDAQLTLTTPYGTFGLFVSEGGLDLEDGASQSVYARPTDIGDPSGTVDNVDIDGGNSLQYHSPKGLLPFDTVIKYGHVTNAPSGAASMSANDPGQQVIFSDSSADALQIKMTPIDGLNLGVSAVRQQSESSLAQQIALTQQAASYAAMVSYKLPTAPVTLGISKAFNEPKLNQAALGAVGNDEYEQLNYSIAFVVNDNLSLSYEREDSEAHAIANATADVEQESSAVQAAYTMGGMTLAVSQGSYKNVGYVVGKEASQTLFAITMAF